MMSSASLLVFMTLCVGVRSRLPTWHRNFERRFNDLEKKVNGESLEFRDELLYLHEKISDNATMSVCASQDADAAVNVEDKDNGDAAVTNVMAKTLLAGLGEEKQYVRRSLADIKDIVDEHQDEFTKTLEDLDRSLRDEVSNVERSLIRYMASTEKQLLDKNTSLARTFDRLDHADRDLIREITKLKEQAATDKASCDRKVLDLKTKFETENTQIKAEIKDIIKKSNCGPWHSFKDSCYFVGRTPASWEKAKFACLSMGAHLAEVDDEQENLFLQELARQNVLMSGLSGPWLGASDAALESAWIWSFSGRNVDHVYRGWPTSRPDGGRGGNCLHLYKQDNFEWNDTGCQAENGFICEK